MVGKWQALKAVRLQVQESSLLGDAIQRQHRVSEKDVDAVLFLPELADMLTMEQVPHLLIQPIAAAHANADPVVAVLVAISAHPLLGESATQIDLLPAVDEYALL